MQRCQNCSNVLTHITTAPFNYPVKSSLLLCTEHARSHSAQYVAPYHALALNCGVDLDAPSYDGQPSNLDLYSLLHDVVNQAPHLVGALKAARDRRTTWFTKAEYRFSKVLDAVIADHIEARL